MRRRDVILALPAIALGGAASAAIPALVVVELFTSESCSSCPAADAVLADLAETRPDLLPLSWHVTYWNRLGWRDRFSLPEATERQRRFAASLGHGQVYTPQAVVQGRLDLVGSDHAALLRAIRAVQDAPAAPVALQLVRDGAGLVVTVGDGTARSATLWLIGYDPRQVTAVGGGENRGRRLVHANVVRGVAPLGSWQGAPLRVVAPPPGERLAVLLQAEDDTILAASRLPAAQV